MMTRMKGQTSLRSYSSNRCWETCTENLSKRRKASPFNLIEFTVKIDYTSYCFHSCKNFSSTRSKLDWRYFLSTFLSPKLYHRFEISSLLLLRWRGGEAAALLMDRIIAFHHLKKIKNITARPTRALPCQETRAVTEMPRLKHPLFYLFSQWNWSAGFSMNWLL